MAHQIHGSHRFYRITAFTGAHILFLSLLMTLSRNMYFIVSLITISMDMPVIPYIAIMIARNARPSCLALKCQAWPSRHQNTRRS